jgi:Tfp pilus assembly protein PilV
MTPHKRTRGIIANQRGMLSLEFALSMVIFVIGTIALAEAFSYFRTVSSMDRATYMVGQILAQQKTLTGNNSGTTPDTTGFYWNQAQLIGKPMDLANNGAMIITVYQDPNGTQTPTQTLRATFGLPIKSQITPAALAPPFPFEPSDTTIVVELYYRHPTFNAALRFWPGAAQFGSFYRIAYFRPRSTTFTVSNG